MNNTSYTLTSKGQVTIPKKLRDAIGLKPGGQASMVLLDERTIAIKAPLPVADIRAKVGQPSRSQPLSAKEAERIRARRFHEQ